MLVPNPCLHYRFAKKGLCELFSTVPRNNSPPLQTPLSPGYLDECYASLCFFRSKPRAESPPRRQRWNVFLSTGDMAHLRAFSSSLSNPRTKAVPEASQSESAVRVPLAGSKVAGNLPCSSPVSSCSLLTERFGHMLGHFRGHWRPGHLRLRPARQAEAGCLSKCPQVRKSRGTSCV